jgi:aminopeptidase YwaD
VRLKSVSRRIPGKGWNVVARKGDPAAGRIVVTAHIDAKKGTPGAIDNATGVVVLLLLAELLVDYGGCPLVEMVAFNGEDYYAVPGQMLYLQQNQERFEEIRLNINIDGAGFHEGKTAISYYALPEEIETAANAVVNRYAGIVQGEPWYQGDHSIFVQAGRAAVAVTSEWFSKNIDNQGITHTPKDNLTIVDCAKLVEAAQALQGLIRALGVRL